MSAVTRIQELPNGKLFDDVFSQTHKAFQNETIREVVQSYLFPADEAGKFPLNCHVVAGNFLPKFINLQNSTVLKSYLAPEFQKYLEHAQQIVKRCLYIRSIVGDDDQYGYVFPMHPEVMAYAMDCARGKIALEIGGANGEHAKMLALAGAKCVYMNDITSNEVNNFRIAVKTLPLEVQHKLASIEGNCLELPALKPALQGKVDFILSRNLIHLLPDVQLEQFFSVLKSTLKPGGLAILSANAKYIAESQAQDVYDKNLNTTGFTMMQCQLLDLSTNPHRAEKLDTFWFPGTPMKNSFEMQYSPIYIRDKDKQQWKPVTESSKKLLPEMRQKVSQVVKNHKSKINSVAHGCVHLTFQFYRAFTKENLAKLVQEHGFKVESTFVTSLKGAHLVDDANLHKDGFQVGVIIRAPS